MSDATSPTLQMLMALRGDVMAKRPARRGRDGVSGPALSPLRGRGMEYAESRIYAAGDDARHMDWRVTARTGQPHTKLFQPERERLTWLVADTAPSLYFGTKVRFKSVQAARLGALAAWSAMRDGDRIGILRGSNSEAPLLPQSGMRGVLPVLDALVRWYAQAPVEDAGLTQALTRVRRLLRPGSRLVVLADSASVMQLDATQWRAIAQHVELHVVVPTDVFELEPPRLRLPLLLGGQRVQPDFAATAVRDRWDHGHLALLESAQSRVRDAGGRFAAIRADAPASDWLAGFHAHQAAVA